jgi:hypothetical protein
LSEGDEGDSELEELVGVKLLRPVPRLKKDGDEEVDEGAEEVGVL